MKIGRNAPCPCGSGQKYKKCCLGKNLTPKETLQYRRLSKVLDTLMPKLIEHGVSVFGQTAIEFAVDEFFGWPESHEIPDEETFDRFAPLFWPWFVFNWAYDRSEDEDRLLDGPEELTVAELYADRRRIRPQSPEGQLIGATSRRPYSFMEVIDVRPRQSVQVKDLLTGEETVVQEILASENLKIGDILFGRVVQVADVGMFLGLCAYVLPPRMKAEIIALRRMVSQGRGKARRHDLDEWDLEIRLAFGRMDQRLHTLPEFENTDGDAMLMKAENAPDEDHALVDDPVVRHHLEQMLRAHWHSWVDTAIPALGGQTPQRAVRTADGRESVEALLREAEKTAADDPLRADIERAMIADVRRRLKLDRPLRRTAAKPDSAQLNERVAQIKKRITEFGDRRLHDVYTGFALRLCETIADSERLNIHRGRIEIWAAAMVYAIAQLNFLFSKETPHCLSPDELCEGFKVKKTTVGSKATMIRKTLELFYDDERFCAPHITRLFQFVEDENGYIFPAAAFRPDEEAVPEAPPLKPAPPESERKEHKVRPKVKKGDDRQLPLFED